MDRKLCRSKESEERTIQCLLRVRRKRETARRALEKAFSSIQATAPAAGLPLPVETLALGDRKKFPGA